MSIYYYLHVGPFIRISKSTHKETFKKETYTEEFELCSKCRAFPAKESAKYCVDCGGIITIETRTKEKKVKIFNPREVIEGLLYKKQVFIEMTNEKINWIKSTKEYIFVSNEQEFGRAYEVKYDDIYIDKIDKNGDIEKFEKQYREELDQLREVFTSVTVEWAIFNYSF